MDKNTDTGIVYCAIPHDIEGLVKIGRTKNLDERMKDLRDGYNGIQLYPYYAIEVDFYKDKEDLLHAVFSHCQIGKTELFAVNKHLVKRLMSSLEGKQIFSLESDQTKQQAFEESNEIYECSSIPEGEYKFEYVPNNEKGVVYISRLKIENGEFTLLKGSHLFPGDANKIGAKKNREKRMLAKIENDILQEDIICDSPSGAGNIVNCQKSCSGRDVWKNDEGKSINELILKDGD